MENFQSQFDQAIKDYSQKNVFNVSNIPVHTHTGNDAPHVSFNNIDDRSRYLIYRLVASASSVVTGTTIGGDLSLPFNGYINGAGATVDTAGTTGDTTIDIKKNGTSIFKTKITINTTKKTSRTATTQNVLDSNYINFVIGDILTFNVDTVSTTAPLGLTVFVNFIQV